MLLTRIFIARAFIFTARYLFRTYFRMFECTPLEHANLRVEDGRNAARMIYYELQKNYGEFTRDRNILPKILLL